MPSVTPSIQSFHQLQLSSSPDRHSSPMQVPGDGFTVTEIAEAVERKAPPSWSPPTDYEHCDIAALLPGPKCFCIRGRIANLFGLGTFPRMPRGAREGVKLLLKDDTGIVTIRLWISKLQYDLRIGQLISVWATRASSSDSGGMPSSSLTTTLCVSLFPERERGCRLAADREDDGTLYRLPLGHGDTEASYELMTINDFVRGGHEMRGSKVLVAVKSIGTRKRITTKQGATKELVKVSLFDTSGEATLTLWDVASASATTWTTSRTVLLLTSAAYSPYRGHTISLSTNTLVDVDPNILEMRMMRRFAEDLTKRKHINPAFPDLFDATTLATSELRVLYTLAEVDEQARSVGNRPFSGYLSVLITEFNLKKLQLRNMLLCGECCGLPVFANSLVATCKQCETEIALRLNPRVIGEVIDETGRVAGANLIWSGIAWQQLFGRSANDVLSLSKDELTHIEQLLRFARVTIVFGWADVVGKLAIARIMA